MQAISAAAARDAALAELAGNARGLDALEAGAVNASSIGVAVVLAVESPEASTTRLKLALGAQALVAIAGNGRDLAWLEADRAVGVGVKLDLGLDSSRLGFTTGETRCLGTSRVLLQVEAVRRASRASRDDGRVVGTLAGVGENDKQRDGLLEDGVLVVAAVLVALVQIRNGRGGSRSVARVTSETGGAGDILESGREGVLAEVVRAGSLAGGGEGARLGRVGGTEAERGGSLVVCPGPVAVSAGLLRRQSAADPQARADKSTHDTISLSSLRERGEGDTETEEVVTADVGLGRDRRDRDGGSDDELGEHGSGAAQ